VVAYFAGFPASFATIMDVFIAVLILLTLILIYRKSGIAFQGLNQWFGQSRAMGLGQTTMPNIRISSPGLGPTTPRAT
jgi:cytochrome bd-type quinol oxidase subunit 2